MKSRVVWYRMHSKGATTLMAGAIGMVVGLCVPLGTALLYPPSCFGSAPCSPGNLPTFLTARTADFRHAGLLQQDAFLLLTNIGLILALLLLCTLVVTLLTRIADRAREQRGGLALRSAVGANLRDLLRPRLGEVGRIVGGGLILGSVIALLVRALLDRSWPWPPSPWGGVPTEPLLLAIAMVAVLILCSAVIAAWPALDVWRGHPRRWLDELAFTASSPAAGSGRDGLAVAQLAAAVVTISSAALLVSASSSGRSSDRAGPEISDSIVVATLGFEWGSTSDAERSRQLQGALERVRTVPGVVDTSFMSEGAFMGLGPSDRVTALCPECGVGSMPKQQTSGESHIRAVTAGFFTTMGIGVLSGRMFGDPDDPSSDPVAVVNRAFALRFIPGGDPLGKEVRMGPLPGRWYRIVGIVDDLPGAGLGSARASEPVVYLSLLQHPMASPQILVQVAPAVDAGATIAAAGVSVQVDGSSLEPGGWATLSHHLRSQVAPLRWFSALFAVLGAAVIALSTAGLHGYLRHSVQRRRPEIGIRRALGADQRAIRRMILRESVSRVGLSVAVGMIPMGGVARLLQLRVEGVEPWSPLLFGTIAGLLIVVSIAAARRPAREAARMHPAAAIRG